ncbi:MAG: NADH-quinone oxidoreductase subunit J [Candidatus Berkiellales bacterium]
MTFQQLAFYSFAILAVLSAMMVITSKNSVRAVLFLVFAFFCTAGVWMILESEFLAIVLVLVYVGAVMVLFLFVVMMLDLEAPKMTGPFVRYWPLGILVTGVLLTILGLTVGQQHFGLEVIPAPTPKGVDYSHVKVLGTLLYTDYLFPFEVAGVILLVAMIAAIGLTFRGPRTPKGQKVDQQVAVRKTDRLRIVSMPSEKEEGGL